MPKKPVPTLTNPLAAEVAAKDAFVRSQGLPATSKQISKSASKQDDFVRATYYLRPEQIKAMKVRAVTEDRNVSELVREAFDAYLKKGVSKRNAE